MRDAHAENLRSLSGGLGVLVGRIVTNAADHIEFQAAEIDRLRALVEEAYLEGFSDGEHSGDSYHHGYGAHRGDETWHDSDARAAIDSSAG